MKAQAKKLAWLCPKWPLPADDGARRATTQLLKELSNLGAEIHLLAIVPENEAPNTDEAIKQLGVKSASVVKRPKPGKQAHITNLMTRPWVALTVAPFGSAKISTEIAAWLDKVGTDATVVYDGLHAAAWERYAPTGSLPKAKIYRAHNVEADIWRRAAEQSRNLPKRAFLRLQAWLMDRFERRLTRQCQIVFPVSDADTERFQQLVPSGRYQTLEIGLAAPQAQGAKAGNSLPLLFIGRLDWPPNRDGLKWFLDRIWPEVSKGQSKYPLSLTIVGSGDGSWLEKYRNAEGVKILGRVPEVDPHYAEAAATLVPVFYGSGTRVKAIEASLFRRACISTEVGVEGIGLVAGKSFLRAETDAEWIRLIRELTPERARDAGLAAFEAVSERFNPKKIAERFVTSAR